MRSLPRVTYLAHYTYTANGLTHNGETEFYNQVYRNKWVAEDDLAAYPQKTWKVWYDPSHPERSTLQKNLPVKESLSTLLLLTILGYLIALGNYVNRTNG